jgi:hypothetical protein
MEVSSRNHPRPPKLHAWRKVPVTHWIWGWVGSRDGLDGLAKRKTLASAGSWTTIPEFFSQQSGHYIDYTIPISASRLNILYSTFFAITSMLIAAKGQFWVLYKSYGIKYCNIQTSILLCETIVRTFKYANNPENYSRGNVATGTDTLPGDVKVRHQAKDQPPGLKTIRWQTHYLTSTHQS